MYNFLNECASERETLDYDDIAGIFNEESFEVFLRKYLIDF